MRILTVPDDTARLRTKSAPAGALTAELVNFLKSLGETLKHQHNPDGIGLSAIQVGRPIRAFATLLPSTKNATSTLVFYLNPVITDHAAGQTLGIEPPETGSRKPEAGGGPKPFLEGCLSIPSIYGPVLRWPWIRAAATVLSEDEMSRPAPLGRKLSNFMLDALASRVFQHELDHLDGVLFPDRTVAEGNRLYRKSGGAMIPVEL